jgi:ceroid-lipofuscinosis MFS transporter 7
VTLDFFGWIIVSYSVGQALASPFFGWWGQRWRTTRGPASCGMILMAIGNLLYASLPSINSNVQWYMMATRFVVGVGSGEPY